MTDLDDLRAKAEAATKGTWHAHAHGGICDSDANRVAVSAGTPDAEFIAAANPAVVLDLLDRIAAVQKLHASIDACLNPGRFERIVKVCTGCGTDDGNYQRWPCPTIKALRGEWQ